MKKLSLLFLLFCFWQSPTFAQKFKNIHAIIGSITGPAGSQITCIRFTPDGSRVVYGNNIGTVASLDYKNTQNAAEIIGKQKEAILNLTFDRTGKYIASSSADGSVKVWEMATKRKVFDSHETIHGQQPPDFYSFAYFSGDNEKLYYGGSEGKVYSVDIFKGGSLQLLYDAKMVISCATYNALNNTLALATVKNVKVINLNTKKLTQVYEDYDGGGSIIDVRYTPDNTKLAVLYPSGKLYFFDAQTGDFIHSFAVSNSNIVGKAEIAFSADGQYLIGSDGKQPKVWYLKDIKNPQMISDLNVHLQPVQTVDFSADGQFSVSSGSDKMIGIGSWQKVYDPATIPTPLPTPIPTAELPKPPPTKPADLPASLEDIKLTYTTRNVPDSLGDRHVKTGKFATIGSEDVEVTVWDSEYEDGDTISIYFNGDWLLKEYPLRSKKKTIKVKVDRNADNYLILYAHNEGTRPPNTAAVTVFDGKEQRRLTLSSDMRNADSVNFRFKKQ